MKQNDERMKLKGNEDDKQKQEGGKEKKESMVQRRHATRLKRKYMNDI